MSATHLHENLQSHGHAATLCAGTVDKYIEVHGADHKLAGEGLAAPVEEVSFEPHPHPHPRSGPSYSAGSLSTGTRLMLQHPSGVVADGIHPLILSSVYILLEHRWQCFRKPFYHSKVNSTKEWACFGKGRVWRRACFACRQQRRSRRQQQRRHFSCSWLCAPSPAATWQRRGTDWRPRRSRYALWCTEGARTVWVEALSVQTPGSYYRIREWCACRLS